MAFLASKIPLVKVLAYGGAGTSAAVTSTAVPSVLLAQCRAKTQQLSIDSNNQYYFLANYIKDSYAKLKREATRKVYSSAYCGINETGKKKNGSCYPLIIKNKDNNSLEPYNFDAPQTNYDKATLEEAKQWAESILTKIPQAKAAAA